MDTAALIGIVTGIGLVISAILMEGQLGSYINTPGLMIVVGGTLSATLLNFRMHDVVLAFSSVVNVFTRVRESPVDTLVGVMKSNELVRMREYQKLDEFERRYAQSMKNRVFGKALRMRVDNLGEEDAVTALRTEIDAVRTRDQITIEVFNKMGAYAPAMGMIGTLIGLINMLESLDNPAELGPSMAIALITTFYGAALATLVFLPIAGKLTIVNSESQINLEIIFEGAIAMAKGYSNSVLYERAIGLIPYEERIEYEELVKRVRYRTS